MNWTKVSAIAEILSSIAILITLIYLSIQVQQNTASIISSSRQQTLNADMQLFRMIADYPEADLGTAKRDGKEGVHQRMVDYALIRSREYIWLQHQDGMLDEETLDSYLSNLINQLQTSQRVKQTWDQLAEEGILTPGFIQAINERLATTQ